MAPLADRRRQAELRPLPGLSASLVRRKDDSDDDDDDDDNSSSRKGKGRFNNKSRGDGNDSGDGNGSGKGRGGGNGGGGGGKGDGGGGDGKGRGKSNNKNNDDSGNGRSKNNDDDTDDDDDNKTKSGNNSSALPPPAVVVNPQLSTPPPAALPPATTSVPPPADPQTVTVEPATVTMSPTTVVVMSTVFPDASTPIAQNPAVTSLVSVQSTGLPTDPVNSQPRKGVDEPEELSPTPVFSITESSTTIFPTALANTTPTAPADNSGDGNKHGDGGERHRNKDGNGNNNNNGDKNGGMSQTAEHLLISAGSIGAFILVCFITWIVWRTMKKSKKRIAANGGNPYTRTDRFLNRVPWIAKRRQTQWDSLVDNGSIDLRGAPPSYREKRQPATLQAQEYYASAPEKPLPQAQSQMAFLPEIAPGQTLLNRSLTANTGYSHQAGESFSSINAAQFMGTMQTDPNLTIRSRMPDAFYNQSELARQPSDAYDPARRQVNRASELSSLSSGFGDGDIIIPETYIRPPQPASQALRQSNNYVGRFSWMSRKSSGNGTNRDTVYTQSSEDSPPRFRSVNSWVNQQTGRVRRAEQRADEEIPPVPDMPIPGVHNPPPEPEMTMMMDDGETPRRPGT